MPRSPTLLERQTLEDRFKYDTPFWAGGVTKTPDGEWRLPGPEDFQGCAKILNKNAELVPLIGRPWQLEFDAALEQQRSEGKPMRAIVLKSRQLGFSTWVAMKFLQRLTMLENQTAVIVAQDMKTASHIFDMSKRAWVHLPEIEQLGLGFNIKPPVIGESNNVGRKHLVFGEASKRLRDQGRTGDSILEIDTAGAPDSGRGRTPRMLHLSELAWYEGNQATRKMTGLVNGVPYRPETIVVMESTANGLNHFYKRWVAAKAGAQDPDSGESYVAIFVPWWRDPECAAPFPTQAARERFIESIGDTSKYGELVDDEPALQEAYDCTPEQLAWRRRMIVEQHESSVELFHQENPANDTEAFIGSGRTVFSGILVAKTIRAAEQEPDPVKGTLTVPKTAWVTRKTRGGTVEVPTQAIWTPYSQMAPDDPTLEVWEHPHLAGEAPDDAPDHLKLDGAYVVSADIAEGKANTFTKGDYHVIQVFDHRTFKQVAIHESRMDIQLLPLWLLQVAIYYNTAWLAPEINGPGLYIVESLRNDYHYPKIIKRSRFGALHDEAQKPGWKTDAQSKQMLEGTFAQALQDEIHGLRDIGTAKQLSTYIITERGKHEAQSGEHDDRLMAAMIAHQIMSTYKPPRPKAPRKLWAPTDPTTGY